MPASVHWTTASVAPHSYTTHFTGCSVPASEKEKGRKDEEKPRWTGKPRFTWKTAVMVLV